MYNICIRYFCCYILSANYKQIFMKNKYFFLFYKKKKLYFSLFICGDKKNKQARPSVNCPTDKKRGYPTGKLLEKIKSCIACVVLFFKYFF